MHGAINIAKSCKLPARRWRRSVQISSRLNSWHLSLCQVIVLKFHVVIRGNDPNHHTLDTLEQCMAFLLERIAGPDNLDVSSCNFQQQSIISRYTNDSKRSLGNGNLLARLSPCAIWGRDSRFLFVSTGFHGEQFTKVVYFTERTVTPFLTVIPRRLGEIALRDFKTLFDRPGVYRYHFKAQDPEYGFVKEEVSLLHFIKLSKV